MNQNYLDRNLGRLVKAYVSKELPRGKSALGRMSDESIVIANGGNYVGIECLVRIDSNPEKLERGLIGNFVTSKVPNNFTDLSYSDYVLFALWEERMQKKERFPTLSEINQYFDPGNMPQAYFIDKKRVRALIYKYHPRTGKVSIKKMIEALTQFKRTRLILAEDQILTDSVMQTIKEMGLVPIIMESLK